MTPVLRSFRMIVLENEFLRVELAPEPGGWDYSFLVDVEWRDLQIEPGGTEDLHSRPAYGNIVLFHTSY